jgi:hypothetical protein
MRDLVIEPKTGKKGRSFRAVLMASIEADLLWLGGMTDTDALRPVWAMFGGSDQELRSFITNLTLGRKAIFKTKNTNYRRTKDEKLEILKSSGYRVFWQREAEGSIATIFLPELFQLDPGMVDPGGVKFVLAPSQEWFEKQRIDTTPLIHHARKCGYHDLTPEQLEDLATLSYLFAAYLDRRTRCPLVADGRFYIQVMLACLKQKLASFSVIADRHYYGEETPFGQHPSNMYYEVGTKGVGLQPGLAFRADHTTLETLLSQEVSTYFSII